MSDNGMAAWQTGNIVSLLQACWQHNLLYMLYMYAHSVLD